MAEPATASRYDLVLKGGRVIDERNGVDGDFRCRDQGRQDRRRRAVDRSGRRARSRTLPGCVVAPGLIDIHTHVYHKATSLSVDPGLVARRAAITTLIDAGSAGAGNYDGFRDYVMAHSPYRILAFLNISFPGIFGFDKDVSDRRGDGALDAAGAPLRRQDRGQSRPHHRREGPHRRHRHRRSRPRRARAGARGRRTRSTCR